MATKLREKLKKERSPATWGDLDESGLLSSMFLVDDQLDLVEVGLALAENQVQKVQEWIANGQLRRPDAGELELWRGQPDALFEMLVIQPFVLIQQGVTLD